MCIIKAVKEMFSMINFCLTIILLSALRNILCQINEELISCIDNKLEYALYICIGVLMFLSEIAKPTKTEIALYQRQKELAVENAKKIYKRAKRELEAVYANYFDKEYNKTLDKQNLKLLPMAEGETLNIEEKSRVA